MAPNDDWAIHVNPTIIIFDASTPTEAYRDEMATKGSTAVLQGTRHAMWMLRQFSQPVEIGAMQNASRDFLTPTFARNPNADFGTAYSGEQYRLNMGREYMDRAAYRSMGAVVELPYAMSGYGMAGDRFAEIVQTSQVGLGISMGGLEMASYASQTMSREAEMAERLGRQPGAMRGLNAVAALGKAGMYIGGALAVGDAIDQTVKEPFEDLLGNFGIDIPHTAEGWVGTSLKSLSGSLNYRMAADEAGRRGEKLQSFLLNTVGLLNLGGVIPFAGNSINTLARRAIPKEVLEHYGISEEATNYQYTSKDPNEWEKKVQSSANRIAETTNLDPGQARQILGAMQKYQFSLGDKYFETMPQLAERGKQMGYGGADFFETVNRYMSMAQYRPGSGAEGLALQSFLDPSLTQAGISIKMNQLENLRIAASPLMSLTSDQQAMEYARNNPDDSKTDNSTLAQIGETHELAGGNVNQKGDFGKIVTGTKAVMIKVPKYKQVEVTSQSDEALNRYSDNPYAPPPEPTKSIQTVQDGFTEVQVGEELEFRDKSFLENLVERYKAAGGKNWSQKARSSVGFWGRLTDYGWGEQAQDDLQIGTMRQFQGYNAHDQSLALRAASGDMQASSYLSYTNPDILRTAGKDVAGSRYYDRAGQPIYQTDFGSFNKMVSSSQNAEFMDALPKMARDVVDVIKKNTRPVGGGLGSEFPTMATSDVMARVIKSMGYSPDAGLMKLFKDADGSKIGAQDVEFYLMQRQQQYQAKSLDLSQQRLSASQTYTRSTWGIEDQQRQLQYGSQMADFRAGMERLTIGNYYNEQQESVTGQRMKLGQQYQMWELGFNYQTSLMQRDWQKQDWQYQDTTRNLNYGWNMTDINEEIRYATGRERRKLIRQRGRMATSFSLEEEQIEKGRDRQEELWAREDEHYQKNLTYVQQLMSLDNKQFDLNRQQRIQMFNLEMTNLQRHMKEYEAQFKLQTQLIQLQRNYQEQSWKFDQQELNNTKEMQNLQNQINATLKIGETIWSGTAGQIQTISNLDPKKLLEPFVKLMQAMGNIDKSTLDAFTKSVNALGNLNPANLSGTYKKTFPTPKDGKNY